MAEPKEILDFDLDFGADIEEDSGEDFEPIPVHKYIPEYEKEVQRYLLTCATLPKNDILYKHVIEPRDLESAAFRRWATEEIRRCRDGHNGLGGKMYFYFNYCYIEQVGKKIKPHFRVVDNEWFKLVEACQKSKKYGIICVKRRRVGASWKEASDMLHDCLFNKHFHIGMNSKTERDSISLFKKVKFQYENLPAFLRVPSTKSNTKNYLDFSYVMKDQDGNKITKGNQSSITAVAPTDNAYEGMMLSKLVMDEAGKVKNLATMFRYAEDCLMQETKRVGLPVIFGTAGDIGAEGKDLQYMWDNAATYKFKKFFFSGWMGLTSDEYGNDSREDGIRWIVYKRHELENLRPEELNVFIQKYPLTIAEAFTVTANAGVGDIIKIKSQMQSLVDNPPVATKGFFKMSRDGSRVDWVPDPKGKCIIYEQPKKGVENLYLSGCDPADHNDVFKEPSDLAMYIVKRQQGTESPKIVFEYSDRPKDVSEYYEMALCALIYYNKAKCLIEKNRVGMITFFENSNFKYLLAKTPASVTRVHKGRADSYGITMTVPLKRYLTECIAKYVTDYWEMIPSRELLNDFLYFGAKNTDKAMAFGITLVYLEDYGVEVENSMKMYTKVPHFGYKNVGGQIVREIYQIKPAQ